MAIDGEEEMVYKFWARGNNGKYQVLPWVTMGQT